MRMNSKWVAFITLVVIFGGIKISDVLGFWETESNKRPANFDSGQFEGQPMPEDIRGSYSFNDVENAFGVDAQILATAFNLVSDDPGSIMVKDLEGIYGELEAEIGTGSIKKFVALFTGLPYEGEDYLLTKARDVLQEYGKWNEEIAISLERRLVEGGDPVEVGAMEPEPSDEETDNEGNEEEKVNGRSTVADVISFGIPLEDIEEVLGISVDHKNMLLRDLCEQNGLSFSSVKDQLNSMLESE